MVSRNTYDTRSFESGHIMLRDLRSGFGRFRFESDEQRQLIACFIASQTARWGSSIDDDLYVEHYNWLLSE